MATSATDDSGFRAATGASIRHGTGTVRIACGRPNKPPRDRGAMQALPDAVIGNAYTSTFAYDLLADLTEVGSRMAGHEGEAEGAAIVRDGLEEAGLRDAAITEFPISGWWRGESSLAAEAADGRRRTFAADYQVLGLPGSPAETVEAEVVDVTPGLPEDFEAVDLDGKIALVGSQNPPDYGRAVNRIEKYTRAVEAGAAGFVYFNDTTDGAIPTTGTIGFCHDFPAAIPAVGASREVGAHLRRYLDAGETTATLSVDARSGDATCRNVEAVVGPAEGPEVLVTGHVDAHDIADGARDNGSGAVLAVEVGRLLALAADDLETRVRVVVFGGEETGLFGARQWAETHDLDGVVGQVNLDGIGYARDLRVGGMGLLDAFEEVGAAFPGDIETGTGATPFTDHWPYVREGVPSVNCRSTAGGAGQVVRYGNVEWGHTHADTLDKIDPRDLRDLAIPVAAAVATIAARADEIDRIPEARVREAIPEGLADFLRLDGRWPW